ncbi:uncharacterized protein TNCV_1446521 [Trichonephila clavipes]|nr:uncharacterized protein TNCV_1446521 [Trichonephila clavipes]
MDVRKCIVPLRHGGTLNSRRAASPLVRLVEEERWENPDHTHRRVLPQNCGGTVQIRYVTVWCSKLMLTTCGSTVRDFAPLDRLDCLLENLSVYRNRGIGKSLTVHQLASIPSRTLPRPSAAPGFLQFSWVSANNR